MNMHRWATQTGQDFTNNTNAKGIDFGGIHVWPDNWEMCVLLLLAGVSPAANQDHTCINGAQQLVPASLPLRSQGCTAALPIGGLLSPCCDPCTLSLAAGSGRSSW